MYSNYFEIDVLNTHSTDDKKNSLFYGLLLLLPSRNCSNQ